MAQPTSLRELANLIVNQAAAYGLIDRRRCRLDVISDDIYRDLTSTDWNLYIRCRNVEISPEVFCLWRGMDGMGWNDDRISGLMENVVYDTEDSVLGNLNVVDYDAIRVDRWDGLLDNAHLRELITRFVEANRSYLLKL